MIPSVSKQLVVWTLFISANIKFEKQVHCTLYLCTTYVVWGWWEEGGGYQYCKMLLNLPAIWDNRLKLGMAQSLKMKTKNCQNHFTIYHGEICVLYQWYIMMIFYKFFMLEIYWTHEWLQCINSPWNIPMNKVCNAKWNKTKIEKKDVFPNKTYLKYSTMTLYNQ